MTGLKRTLTSAIVAALMMMLAGCGGGEAPQDVATPANPPATANPDPISKVDEDVIVPDTDENKEGEKKDGATDPDPKNAEDPGALILEPPAIENPAAKKD